MSSFIERNKQQVEKTIQEFSNATGLAAVYVDIDGQEVSKYYNFTPFCEQIRKVPQFHSLCQKCDKFGGLEASKNGKYCLYRCHAGLVDFAIPVKSQNAIKGFLLSGQILMEDSKENTPSHILQQEQSDLSQYKELALVHSKLQSYSYEKISSSAELLNVISDYYLSSILQKQESDITQMSIRTPGVQQKKEIKKALKYISKHLNQPITLEEVADHVYLSPFYLSKLFKKEMNETFISYVNRQKIKTAKELLKNEAVPIAYIARNLGFSETSYFCKVFKKYGDETPTDFRARYQKNS